MEEYKAFDFTENKAKNSNSETEIKNTEGKVDLSKNSNSTNNKQYQQQYQQNINRQCKQISDVVTPDKLAVEPALACVLSILLTGLGQMINGQIEKGLLLLFGGIAAISIITFITCGFGAILSPLLVVISALDAYKCSKRLQMGQSLGKYEFHIFD